ncbi:MAG: M56 family metallopeptidase, partial [Flavisolibacter sp.]
HFLQSLGWATLNSFWQMALLWCIYSASNYIFALDAHKKYRLSVLAIFAGFAWFILSFIYFYQNTSVSCIGFFNQSISESDTLLRIFLLSASVAYLGLLVFPSYRLFRNWQFVQQIKKEGLQKANLNYRLFVQKISAQLGIKKKVFVYLSELVNSPVTIGYLKPIILLPVAALNNLSTHQVEAILLHELSHIRRYDYLVNLVISIINTLLYFNPFMKLFMKNIEEERENCCDQLVLQYGYDKVSYASALLTLEKLSVHHHVLALGATGRNYLLSRIEKIIGMEKKKGFKMNQFAGILAALFCIVAFNSFLIIKEKKKGADYSFAFNNINTPFSPFDGGNASSHSTTPEAPAAQKTWIATAVPDKKQGSGQYHVILDKTVEPTLDIPAPASEFMNVGYDDVEGSLTKEQKDKVKSTVAVTKKVLSSLQWKEVENSIADAMNDQEKAKAKQEYLKALDQNVNWKNVEQNMKAQYEKIDWNVINTNIDKALTVIELDSLQKNYSAILVQLDKANAECALKGKVAVTPLPDQSVEEIKKSRLILQEKVRTIKALQSSKKVVRL